MAIVTFTVKHVLHFLLLFRTFKCLHKMDSSSKRQNSSVMDDKMLEMKILEVLSLHAISPLLLHFCLPYVSAPPFSYFAPLPLLMIMLLYVPNLNLTTLLIKKIIAPLTLDVLGKNGVVRLCDWADYVAKDYHLSNSTPREVERETNTRLAPTFIEVSIDSHLFKLAVPLAFQTILSNI